MFPSKYRSKRTNGYASKREANRAAELAMLVKAGIITGLQEQVPVVLVQGKDGVQGVSWIADFFYRDEFGKPHWEDVKGFRTPVYKIKKRLAYLLLGITIEEV